MILLIFFVAGVCIIALAISADANGDAEAIGSFFSETTASFLSSSSNKDFCTGISGLGFFVWL